MSVGAPDDNAILNSVPDGISINTGDSFVFVNQPFALMTGYSVNELLGMKTAEVVIPEDAEKVVEYALKRQKGIDVPSKYDVSLLKKDGTVIPAELSVSVITYKGNNSSLTVVRDISYRKQTEESLQETEANYQTLFQNTGETILVHRLGKEIIEINDAGIELFGYTREEILQLTPLDISVIHDRQNYDAEVQFIREHGKIARDTQLRKKDGTIIDAKIISQPIRFRNEEVILSVISDITERKRYENSLHLLHSHASRIALANNHQEIFDLTLETVNETMDIKRLALGFVYEDELVYEYFSDIDDNPLHLPLNGKSISARVVKNGVSEIVQNVDVDPDFLNLFPEIEELTKAELVVPVILDEKVIAILNIGNYTTFSFTDDDKKLIETLAEHIASSINRINQTDQIKESELQLRNFMESANDGFTIIDKNLRILSVNSSWLKQASLARDEVIGKKFTEIMPNIVETDRYDAYIKVLENGVPKHFTAIKAASDDGLYLDVSAFKTGEYLGLVTRDVTDAVEYQRNLEMLHGHAASLTTAASRAEIVAITQDSIKRVLGKEYSTVGFVEGDNLVYDYLWDSSVQERMVLPLNGPGISVKAVRDASTIRVDDLRGNELYLESSGRLSARSELDVPLFLDAKAVGVINLESNEVSAFTDNDQRLVEILASHVSAALSRINYSERLNLLYGMTQELGYAGNLDEIIRITFSILREFFGFTYLTFLLVEGDNLVTQRSEGAELETLVLPLDGPGITVKAANTKTTILLNDVTKDPDYVDSVSESQSELAVPIFVEEVMGILNVESIQKNAFTEQDARLMETLAQNVASAIFRTRVEDERKEMERKLMLERVRAEQEHELNQLKTRFMSTATHEIRTPLASIQGYVEIIRDIEGGLNENQRNYFDVIHRNVQRLTILTDDLLDLQRLEENRVELNIESVNVPEIVDDLYDEFSPILADKEQTLMIKAYDGSWSMDRLRVMQVLINLLSNASKFSPIGSEIKLKIYEEKSSLRFDVEDKGIGLDPEDIEKLFYPFPGILVKGNVQGTGLGLSICKGIIGLHNGHIWARSRGIGEGMTFSFTLPWS